MTHLGPSVPVHILTCLSNCSDKTEMQTTDNLQCHQWRLSQHHGNSRPSVDVLRVEISAKAKLPLAHIPQPDWLISIPLGQRKPFVRCYTSIHLICNSKSSGTMCNTSRVVSIEVSIIWKSGTNICHTGNIYSWLQTLWSSQTEKNDHISNFIMMLNIFKYQYNFIFISLWLVKNKNRILEQNRKKISHGGGVDIGNGTWCMLVRACLCRTGHFCAEPCISVSNQAFLCGTSVLMHSKVPRGNPGHPRQPSDSWQILNWLSYRGPKNCYHMFWNTGSGAMDIFCL